MKERNRIFRRKSGSCCSRKFLPSADHGAARRKARSADRAADGFEHIARSKNIQGNAVSRVTEGVIQK